MLSVRIRASGLHTPHLAEAKPQLGVPLRDSERHLRAIAQLSKSTTAKLTVQAMKMLTLVVASSLEMYSQEASKIHSSQTPSLVMGLISLMDQTSVRF